MKQIAKWALFGMAAVTATATLATPLTVMNAAGLAAITNDLAGSYVLGADIDLSGSAWTPIGTSSQPFTGTLNGNGFKITGLTFNNTSRGDSAGTRVGLFRCIDGATIDGVHLEDVSVNGYERCGALAGEVKGASTIRNCSAQGSVSGNSSSIGLLAGYISGPGVLFEGCATTGTVSAAGSDAGGFIAYVGSPGTFIDCSANVSVSGGFQKVGGFAGYIRDGADGSSFLRCTAAGDVSATDSDVGGFVGFSEGEVSITDCRADGYVCGNGKVGGFVGSVSAPLVISNCVARGDVRSTGNDYGGFVGNLNIPPDAAISDCWCSGAVWGTGGMVGSFVGYKVKGAIRNCSVDVYGAGPRPFCGNNDQMTGGSLTAHQVEELSKDGDGTPWPEVKQHVSGATMIRTAEDLFAVTNNLAGIYVLDCDIDLGGAAWTPLGNASVGFTGEFYGQNHCISNFVVNTTDRYAGFFGRIAGGRVNGVVLEGTVTGAPASSDMNVGVGGFAGTIDSNSLVDGCSFQGAVTNSITYSAGGFVGYVPDSPNSFDSPVILRCCVLRATVANTSSEMFTGGFVAWLSGGYVMDCYAVADVNAGGSDVGGFAGFVNGLITNAWCAGSVTASGSSRGAFAGGSNPGYIKNSYYDYNKTSLGAVNNAGDTGVTGLGSMQMRYSANFAFDFDRTWKIDEGKSTPYLRTFLEQLTSWAELQQQLDTGGVVTLTKDHTAMDGDVPLTLTTTVTLDLAGHTLNAAGQCRVIDIHCDGHLTLTNSVPGSGAITGGFADYGGGVYVNEGGRFTMTGGTISGNTAEHTGGGVNVARASDEGTPGGAFEMTGGIITGNFAEDGGGVFIEDHYEQEEYEYDEEAGYEWSYTITHEGGYFSMSGGSVTGNGVSGDGGGVFAMDVDSLSVSGAPVISGNTNTLNEANNVYLNAWGGIVVDPLSGGASIGVTSYMPPGPGSHTVFTYSVASDGDSQYFFSDDPAFSVGLAVGQLCLINPSEDFKDPEGREIEDPVVIDWLSDNGFMQADIDALGGDAAATDKLYEYFLLNCDFRAQDPGATLSIAAIAVSNDVVSVTVQLVRKAPLGAIYGVLYLYGADDLATGFGGYPIEDWFIDFGSDDPSFDTDPASGLVTQTATATFSVNDVTKKFFKAAIGVMLPDEPYEPWEPEDPE